MFVTNWISPTKIQKISEITNFFRHYFLSRTEVYNNNKANVEAAVSMLSNGKDSNGTDLWWAMKENGTY